VLKGNRSEVLAAAEVSGDAVQQTLERLAHRTGRPAYCTMGEQGMLVARPQHEATLVDAYPVSEPIDIVGAGDAASSGIVGAVVRSDCIGSNAFGNLVASSRLSNSARRAATHNRYTSGTAANLNQR
jgi:sugar/nucleoside kinase (ribokinase family)